MMSHFRNNRGQDLLEFSLLFPLLLLLLFGIVEFSIAVFVYDTIANAAREGARVGIIPSNTDDDVRAAVLNRAVWLDLADLDIDISRFPQENTIRVQVDYDHDLIIAMIMGTVGSRSLHMATVATMRMER